MKKIFTVTFHRADNYGAVIQAYALQKVLEKNYETQILDYDNKRISDDYRIFKKTNKNSIKTVIQFAKDLINCKKEIVRKRNYGNFREKLKLTRKFDTIDEVKKDYPKADVYITGSDQVWNPELTDGLNDVYTLNFGDNNFKKISYAASCGSIDSLKNDKVKLEETLKNFDNISVRENSLQLELSKTMNKNIELVLDPSLLLTKEDWIAFAGNNRIIKEKYIFVYCGDEPQLFYDIINEIAERTGYLIVYFGRRDRKNNFKHRKKSCYESGPIEFVNLINNAEYVITASFHGTALATILNKEMFIVLNRASDRLATLLNGVNLRDRIISNMEEFEKAYNTKTNWDITNQMLKEKKKASINWLYNAIEDN